MTKALILLISK